MKVRIFLLGIILGAALVLPAVSAQNGSIIGESTFGLFTDDVDDFLDPNDYEGVEFDNAFIYVKGGRNGDGFDNGGRINKTNGAGIQGGFATRFSSFYLGFAFDTNLWDGEEDTNEVDGDRHDTPATIGPTPPRDTTAITFDGGFGLLLGTGNIGAFKLTLDFDEVSLDNNEDKDGNPEKSSYSDGSLLIDLGWGKNFEFKGGVLAPEVHIGYQISTYKVEMTNPDGYSYVKAVPLYPTAPITITRDNFFDEMSHLIINPGAEYTSATGAHWFAVGYELDIGIHPVKFYKNSINDEEYDWKGYDVRNTLGGEYTRSVSLTDRFALAFGGGLDFALRSSKVDFTDIDNLGDPREYVDFSIDPYVKIGATYDFAKKPFQLYSAFILGSTALDGNDEHLPLYNVSYAEWVDSSDDTHKTYTHTFKPWGLSAGLGLKFTPIKNFTLDIGLSQNLSYYVSDKLEFGINFDDHPFTAELQLTFKF
jgi:hypothetical protein